MTDLKNRIASVRLDDNVYGDNLAIALCTYFSDHPNRPENDPDGEDGWGEWVSEQYEEAMRRIVAAASREVSYKNPHCLNDSKPCNPNGDGGCVSCDRVFSGNT